MKLIRNTIIYKAELPAIDHLVTHLAEKPFTEPLSLETQSHGFVPPLEGEDIAIPFTGGLAFAVRIDTKIIPASAIKNEAKKRAARIEAEQGIKPGRKLMREIREMVVVDLLPKALIKSKTITCFYDTERQLLIVPTSSKTDADIVVSLLIRTVGSVKTTTIHVSDIKHGLTTRLRDWLTEGEDDFYPFNPCDEVVLKREKEKVAIKVTSLESRHVELLKSIDDGFTVDSIRFQHGTTFFRLDSNFRLKGLQFDYGSDADLIGTELWQHEAAIQVMEVGTIVDLLCNMLGYKPPAEGAE